MKKLLLCVFTLTYALTMQSMGNKELTSSTSGLYAALTSAPGMVTRYMQATHLQPANLVNVEIIEQSSAASSSSEAIEPLTQAMVGTHSGLRLNSTAYHSWNRISIADPYPADNDDAWDIVTNHDVKTARVMEAAQNILLDAKKLLPNDLQSCITNNIHESGNPLKELETARQLIWACITRTSPTFATDYIETLNKNFDPCKKYVPDFDYSKVYRHLKYDNDFAMNEPNEELARLIKQKLDLATIENDEETQWLMRQFGFMFRDPATKQTYDAYLKGGQEALKALMISEEKIDALQACFDRINNAKHDCRELLKERK